MDLLTCLRHLLWKQLGLSQIVLSLTYVCSLVPSKLPFDLQSGGQLVWNMRNSYVPYILKFHPCGRFIISDHTAQPSEPVGNTVRDQAATVTRVSTAWMQELALLSILLEEVGLNPAFIIYPDMNIEEVN